MNERNQTLRKEVFKRDNFTCQKCKIQDKTARTLESHHIVPLILNGEDSLSNLITLCSDCHHFAPNKKEEFEQYIKEECTGTMTTFINAWTKVQKEHPELFNKNSFK
ncbi:HNH endonuclease [Candidatus Woesearchaeota archaeon]|nr:HNH endonuclease [Candidatus Woesearchaeota archaeon]